MSYARTNRSRPINASMQPETTSSDASGTSSTQSRELQHQGAFAVKAPDPAKRDKIQRVANAETESYEQYKQNRRQRVQYVTTTSSVGSASTSQSSTFGRLAGDQLPARVMRNPRNPVPVRKLPVKAQMARMDEPEIERRKAVQRQKAEDLKSKQAARHDKLDEERRRANSKFLDRLEGKR
ncbi:epithelial-stromal interaction protein 1-like [Watersipora subatra]|uniref:epithelial-stromal interaction protein 1-like n=1 Tax=Watersipora subatra TaxID=2589382 RepID=UPI00355BB198